MSEFERPTLSPEEIAARQAKHTFRKAFRQTETPDSLPPSQKAEELVKNFQWAEDEEEEGFETYCCSESDMDNCAEVILDYISKNMNLEEMDPIYGQNLVIRCKIPPETHSVLQERFNNRWSLDSRIEAIEGVRDRVANMLLHPEIRIKLTERLQVLMPTARASWEVIYINIDDDDVIMGGSSSEKIITASIEIGKQHV